MGVLFYEREGSSSVRGCRLLRGISQQGGLEKSSLRNSKGQEGGFLLVLGWGGERREEAVPKKSCWGLNLEGENEQEWIIIRIEEVNYETKHNGRGV